MHKLDSANITIKHYLTGRARLLVPSLKMNSARLAGVVNSLEVLPGVEKARGSAATGKLLIYFEESLLNLEDIISTVETILSDGLTDTKPAPAGNLPETRQRAVEPEDLSMGRQAVNVALGGGVLGYFAVKHAMIGKSPLARSEKLFNLAAATTIITGYPVFRSAAGHLAARGRINHDLVMSALGIGTLLLRESLPGLLVVWLVNLNSLIQSLVQERTKKMIEKYAGENENPESIHSKQEPGNFLAGETEPIKIPAEKYAEKIVPASLGMAAAGAVLTREPAVALATLLAASPSPAGLARPGAMAAVAALALKKGILVRRPAAFARLKDVDSLIFAGANLPGCHLEVSAALPVPGYTSLDLVEMAQTAFEKQNHNPQSASGVKNVGITAEMNGRHILVGSREFMKRSLVNTYPGLIKEKRLLLQNMFPLFTACNGILAGVLGLKYRISAETRNALNNIRARGVTELYTLADETNPAAATLAAELGLEILAPAELDGLITERKKSGGGVAFVGYVLEGWEQWDAADVKILIKHRSGIYRLRQADLILEREDLNLLSEAIALSFRASEKERQNVEITALSNTLGIALAFSRILSPVGASIYNSLTSVTVSLNSLSLLYR